MRVVLQRELDEVALADADEVPRHLAAERPEGVVDAVGEAHRLLDGLELDDHLRRMLAGDRCGHVGCGGEDRALLADQLIQQAGFAADSLDVSCAVSLEDGAISSSILTLKASVPGLDKAKFDELVDHAEHNCPISKLFNTTIKVDATLA